jgi:hypothetical protein
MAKQVFMLFCSLPFLCVGGCADLYTTDSVRTDANNLATQVAAYNQQQKERISKINADYQATYDRLYDTLVQLESDEQYQSYTLDAMRFSDLLVSDPDVTLPGRFRDTVQNAVKVQRAKIDEVDAKLAAARNAYADSYTEVSLNLAKLKSVQTRLESLAQTEDEARNIRQLIEKIYNAYQVIKKREKEAATQPAAAKP